jgi:hypothetical protein
MECNGKMVTPVNGKSEVTLTKYPLEIARVSIVKSLHFTIEHPVDIPQATKSTRSKYPKTSPLSISAVTSLWE